MPTIVPMSMVDSTGSYTTGLIVFGAIIALGSLLLVPLENKAAQPG